jgi:hypothetical protein
MFKKTIIFSSLLLILSAGASSVTAQWVDLGTKEVKDRSEQDTWHVGKDKGDFRRIKIAVGERAVRFYRLRVTFENGRTEDLELRSVIRAGGESRAIDLKGAHRYIDKIDIWYEANTARRGRRSRVTLFGIR